MTIKVRQKMTFSGKPFEVDVYLPEEELLTNIKRQEADILDSKVKIEVENINLDYFKLKSKFRNSKEKWYWLGEKLDTLIKKVLFKQEDMDSNIIWHAIRQYLYKELIREDEKRSGTPQDHLNKCWLLYKTKNHEWIRTWAGWDALTERGDQLLNEKLLLELGKEFSGDLKSKDYQFIFKQVVKYIPSLTKRKEIFLMSENEIKNIISKIKEDLEDNLK